MNRPSPFRRRRSWIGSTWRWIRLTAGRLGQWVTLPVIFVLVILNIVLPMWQIFLVPHQYPNTVLEKGPASEPVSLILAYADYIAGGDQGYIDVTIFNEGDRPISRNVIVDFTGDGHVICMSCSEKNEVEFKDLMPRVRQTRRISFVLNETPSFHLYWLTLPPVQFSVKVTDEYGRITIVFPDQKIYLAPVPYLRAFLRSGFVVALLTLPIEWLKKKLVPG
jgi:hypothetical protein